MSSVYDRIPVFFSKNYTNTDHSGVPYFLNGIRKCRPVFLFRNCSLIIRRNATYDYREKYRGDMNVLQSGKHNVQWFRRLYLPEFCIILAVMAVCLLAGCVARPQKTQKLRDLEFTVLDKDTVPEEFALVIDEQKAEPFKLTYADQGYLYIAEGYGAQPTTGYSVEVNGLYETEDAVYIHTNLLGPEKGEEIKKARTFPYVVVRLEYVAKTVLFD